MNTYATVVLAAGKGTRMRSTLPKVLHSLAGVPLLAHVLKAIEGIPSTPLFSPLSSIVISCPYPPVVVLGHEATQVEAAFGGRCLYALQTEQLGTGHAVAAVQPSIDTLDPQPETVLVCYGDTPLVRSEALAQVLFEHFTQYATVTFLTAFTEQPSDFGRVIRNSKGQVSEIVEAKQATEEQKSISEINTGVYCFDRSWLWSALPHIPRNATGEYYLTDLVSIASSQGHSIATVHGTFDETIGINDRVQLAAAEHLLRRRVLEQHMYAGVTIVDPDTTYIDDEVTIGIDTVILPGTMITGKARLGEACRIGPSSVIDRSTIGDHCTITHSTLEGTKCEDNVQIGPYSHCRPGAYLASGVKMGNFGEVKNSYIGPATNIHHFSYIGDATLGEHVNVGAGTITCNYDGVQKHRTIVGNRASLGSDTLLVAPLTVGEQAQTGAGAVVTNDVPPGALVVGVPARIIRLPQAIEHDNTE